MFIFIGLLAAALPTVLGCLGFFLGCSTCCGSGSYSYPYQTAYPSYTYLAYPRPQYYPPVASYSPSYVPVHPTPYVVPSRPSYYPRVAPVPYPQPTYIPPSIGSGYVQPSPVYPPSQVQVSPTKLFPAPRPTYNPGPIAPHPSPVHSGNYVAPPQAVLVETTTEKIGEEVAETGNTSYGDDRGSVVSPVPHRVSNTVTRPSQQVPQEMTNTVAVEYEPEGEDYLPGGDDSESSPLPLVGVVTQTPEVPSQAPYNPPTVAPQTEPFFPPVSIPGYAPETEQTTSVGTPVEEVEYVEEEVTPPATQENEPAVEDNGQTGNDQNGEPEVTVDGGVGDDGNSIGYGRRRKAIRAN